MTDLRDRLHAERPLLFDGAMGTMLYARGVFINQCFDEIVLKAPALVSEVHEAYVAAGAEILETNTFGATRHKLAHYGLEGRVGEINATAARLAKKAAGSRALVVGAVGPLGIRLEPFGPTSLQEAFEAFLEAVGALESEGVDGYVLETFSDPLELEQALKAVRAVSRKPVVAQMTIQEDGATSFGDEPAALAARLAAMGADAVGLNCSVGPATLLPAIEAMRARTDRPLAAQPNAGLPREVAGRQIYLASPEYMARYAKRLYAAGARVLGGCCGTTPAHVQAMSDVLRAVSPSRIQVAGVGVEEAPACLPEVPLEARSRFGAKLAAGEWVTSVEIVPPKGTDASELREQARALAAAGVDAVNVPDGPRAQSRMSALAASMLIEREGIEAVVHYCCRDRNLLGMQSDLLGAHALGLRNLLLITGDPPKMGPYPQATAVFDIDAIGLTNLVSRLNRGLDLGGKPLGSQTGYVMGVGVNPGALDLEHELRRFAWKVEAGAQYAITQPVFDPAQLLGFLERVKDHRIPIIAGIWPLASYRNAEFMANEVPGVTVPPAILARMKAAEGAEAQRAEGVAIAREMLASVRDRIQGVQVSAPLGKVEIALAVLGAPTPSLA